MKSFPDVRVISILFEILPAEACDLQTIAYLQSLITGNLVYFNCLELPRSFFSSLKTSWLAQFWCVAFLLAELQPPPLLLHPYPDSSFSIANCSPLYTMCSYCRSHSFCPKSYSSFYKLAKKAIFFSVRTEQFYDLKWKCMFLKTVFLFHKFSLHLQLLQTSDLKNLSGEL